MQVLRIILQIVHCLGYPRKGTIRSCLEAKLYNRKRRTAFGHGLSDEEKKDTSDKFELHLELGNSRSSAAVVLIVFCLVPTFLHNCQDNFYVVWVQNIC